MSNAMLLKAGSMRPESGEEGAGKALASESHAVKKRAPSFFLSLRKQVRFVVITQVILGLVLIACGAKLFELFKIPVEAGEMLLVLMILLIAVLPTALLLSISLSINRISNELHELYEKKDWNGPLYKSRFAELALASELIEKYASQLKQENTRAQVLEKLTEHLEKTAITDPLTGLMNRKAFDDMEQKFPIAPTGTALLMVDIDHFKHINDTFGHLVGDEVLKLVAKKVKHHISETDMALRLGGDEFCIVLNWMTVKSPALVAERLRREVKNTPFHANGKLVTLKISVGVSKVNLPNSQQFSFRELYQQADAALYRAKQGGRDSYALYEDQGLEKE